MAKNYKNRGVTMLELVISLAIFAIIFIVIMSFIFWMDYSNNKTKADRETLENARRVLDVMTYEIKEAKSIYTPTTTANQLSLETSKYLPADENTTYIDFFLCGSAICEKKESQSPVSLTSDSTQVTSLTFSQLLNGTMPSITITMTINYKNPGGDSKNAASVTLTSTASMRSYSPTSPIIAN